MNLSKFKTLGVINRTPNSFSDHGQSLNPQHFEWQLKSFLEDPTVIVDVGFESTAPMNQAVSSEEEFSRFENFLEASKGFSFENKFISFDTYKVQNFLLMAEAFKKLHPKVHFIFNDVSGVLDDELQSALLKFKDENFYYIYTFAHIPSRNQVLDHMKFLHPENDVIVEASSAFKKAYDWFKSFQVEDHLILDPGLGFSKTFEQNWQLINHWSELESQTNLDVPMLVGLSKKSFLKKALEAHPGQDLEGLHQKCIQDIQKASKRNLLFRVHDPKIMDFSL
jgi:dihydropteroate synthase